VILLWAIMIGNLVFWIWFWAFRGRDAAGPPQQLLHVQFSEAFPARIQRQVVLGQNHRPRAH